MVVRGAGLNTQILLVNRGTLACIYTPDDPSYIISLPIPSPPMSHLRRNRLGPEFWRRRYVLGDIRREWQWSFAPPRFQSCHRHGHDAYQHSFASVSPDDISLPGHASQQLARRHRHGTGPDVVRLYDLSDTNFPVLLDRQELRYH